MVTETPTDDYRFRVESRIERYGFLWLRKRLVQCLVLTRSVHRRGQVYDTGDPQYASNHPIAEVDEIYYRDVTPEEFLNEYNVLCQRLAFGTQTDS